MRNTMRNIILIALICGIVASLIGCKAEKKEPNALEKAATVKLEETF